MEFSHPPCLHSQAHGGDGLVCVLHERLALHGSVAGLRSRISLTSEDTLKTTDALKDIGILITALLESRYNLGSNNPL